jgi:hypothetical protein
MHVELVGAKATQPIDLLVPASMTLRYELIGQTRASALRVYAACLAACWPGYASKKGAKGLPACGHDVLVFGGAASDWLLAAGVPPSEIVRVGSLAHEMIVESLPAPAEVESAAKNSEAGENPAP